MLFTSIGFLSVIFYLEFFFLVTNAPTLPIIPVNNMNAEVNRPASPVLGVDCTAEATDCAGVSGVTGAGASGCAGVSGVAGVGASGCAGVYGVSGAGVFSGSAGVSTIFLYT